MGFLYYGSSADPIHVPDHILMHVKVVATTKLRRGECFTLSWRHTEDQPLGRTTLWMQPAIPLRFVFDGPDAEPMDRARLHDFVDAANSSGGMVIDLGVHVDDGVVAAAEKALQDA